MRFENKNIFLYFNKRSSLLQRSRDQESVRCVIALGKEQLILRVASRRRKFFFSSDLTDCERSSTKA
jgi:hypothetical protein